MFYDVSHSHNSITDTSVLSFDDKYIVNLSDRIFEVELSGFNINIDEKFKKKYCKYCPMLTEEMWNISKNCLIFLIFVTLIL